MSGDGAIPRILHQTWKTREIPARFRGYSDSWRAHNPGWEHRLWSDDDNDGFIRARYPGFHPTFRAYRTGIQRADAVRYFLLHAFGGLYVDLDFECLRPIGPVLEGATCVLGCEPRLHAERLHARPRLLCNAIMASAPGHPFWLRVHDELRRRAALFDGRDPVESTGPKVVDAAYRSWAGGDVRLVDPEVFYPVPDLDSAGLGLTPKERAYYANMVRHHAYWRDAVAVHHWSHTWIPTHGVRARARSLRRSLGRVALAVRGRITADEVLRSGRYGVVFDEAAFAPRPSRAEAWHAALTQARVVAGGLRVAFCVLLHDRIDLVPLLRRRIEHLGAAFADWRLVIYGADSRDGTAEALERWAAEEPRVVLPAVTESAPRGIGRIAALRNHLLGAVERAPVDVVAMLDGDLAGPVSRDGLVHAVGLLRGPSPAAAVSACGVNNYVGIDHPIPVVGATYYDTFAFRVGHGRRRGHLDVRRRFLGVRRGDPPMEVDSAFGGCTVYDAGAIAGLRYDRGGGDCEHVSLHRALRDRGGRVLVDPSFLLLSGRQGHHEGLTTV